MTLTTLLQNMICWQYGRERKKFSHSLNHLEKTQRSKLKDTFEYLNPYYPKLHSLKTYEEFIAQTPITHYADWKHDIEQMRKDFNHPFRQICSRFEPTSGSTNTVKWIPYTQGFLQELNKAAAIWLSDTFSQYPEVLKGKHYWSLSWVPPELRRTHNSNDVELFPLWQRGFLSKIMAVPEQVKSASTQEASWFASLTYLVACTDLSLISIWSPTFLLQIVKDIYKYKYDLATTLQNGQWSLFSSELSFLNCPRHNAIAELLENLEEQPYHEDLQQLWPKLALISCWDSSTAATWIPELQKLFPHTPLQGKGLWATEGVVTIPFQGQKILAAHSHFYEFRCLETQKIIPSWEVKQNMFVQPIITSKNGLLRYELPDKMQASGFIGSTPCLNFISRINSIDLVGEKIDFDTATEIIQHINQNFSVRGLCFIAEKNSLPKPKYKFLIEGNLSSPSPSKELLEAHLENKLCSHYHYQLSRTLGQLGPCEVLEVKDSLQTLKNFQKSSIGGNNKIEPIVIQE